MHYFGSFPYKYSWYDDSTPDSTALTNEQLELRDIMREVKSGEFSALSRLIPLLRSRSSDVRQYSTQLLADACGHQEVILFKEAHNHAELIDEHSNLLMRLGESFSLQAIPLILEIADDIDHPDVYEHAAHALNMILPLQGIDEFTLADEDVTSVFSLAIAELDPTLYYYKGNPIFLGDICKEYINAAAVSLRNQRGAILVVQPQILSNFSSIECPVRYGDIVNETIMSRVMEYVHTISSSGVAWKRGAKYFWAREV